MKGLYGWTLLILLFAFSTSQGQTVTSAQSGPWNDPLTWSPQTIPTASNSTSIVINSGHVVTYDAAVTGGVDQLTIDGELIVNSGVTLTLANGNGDEITVTSSGALTNNGSIAFATIPPNRTVIVQGTLNNNGLFQNANASRLFFNPGSSYNHMFADGGIIPPANWDVASTVNIVGYTSGSTTPPTGLNQVFGNLVWNCPNQDQAIALNGLGTLNLNIEGDFRVESTGTEALIYSAGGAGGVANIGGNLQVTGGVVVWTTGDAAPSTINIGGNLEVSSTGYFLLADDVDLTVNVAGGIILSDEGSLDLVGSTATTSINLQGDYTHTGGNLYVSGGTGNINFVGASIKTFNSQIKPEGNVNYSVAALSTLNIVGESFVGGGGNFTVNGTLRLGSLAPSGALQTGGLAGNVRITGARTYVAGATIVYAGVGPQFIGNGFPSGADINLTVDNPSGVTLSTSLDIVAFRQLNLAQGNIVIGTQTLTINGQVTGSGGIIGGPDSKMIIGGTGDFGTLTFNGTSELKDLTINRTGSGVVTLGGDLRILGTLTHTNGTLVVGSNTLRISGNYEPASPGPMSVTSESVVLIDGEGSLPSDVSFSGTDLGTLTMDRANATFPTSSSIAIHNLNLYAGIVDNGSGLAIAANGTIRRRGGNSPGSMTTSPNNTTVAYNVVYEDGAMTTGPELPSNSTALQNLTKSGTGQLTLGSDITVNGTLALNNGSFAAGSNAINLKGNFASNAASTLTGSIVTFSGTTVITGSSSPTFGDVVISGIVTPNVNYRINGDIDNAGTLNAGTGSVTFGGSTEISGGSNSFNNVTILASSSLTGPPLGSINVAGTFANNGSFVHNSGTVVFNGNSTVTGVSTLFNNITVEGTLTGPSNLRLAGNLNINGSFVANNGNITFEGTGAQRLDRTSGTGSAIVDLYNVTISKPSNTFSVASTVAGTVFRVANRFEITQNGTSGTDVDFDGPSNNGTLVLRSTATRTAMIPTVPSGTSVVGNITVERYIPNSEGIRSYRYFASPVVGATVADWQEEIAITGQFSNPTSIGNPNSPSMYQYLETIGGVWGARYQAYPNNVALPASSFPLENGRGYAVYMYNSGTPTINTRGTLRIGTVNIPLTATGAEPGATGFNLIGNPYPAPIDWDLVSLPPSVSAALVIKDNVDNAGSGAGNYMYYLQGGPNVGSFNGVVASGQAFWIYTTDNTTLEINESHKVSDPNPVVVREKTLANVLRINLEGNGRHDETVVWLKDEATDGIDLKFDAPKKVNDYLNLYTILDNSRYAINGLKDFGCSRALKIGISDINGDSLNVVAPGVYSLNFLDIETFITEYNFSLIDKFRNKIINLRSQPVYSFEITADPKTFGEDRFELVVSQPTFTRDNVVHYDDVCSETPASITVEASNPNASYFVRDDQGQTVSDVVKGNGNALVLSVPGANLNEGINKLMVYAQNGTCEALPLERTVDLRVDPVYSEFQIETARSCGPGQVTLSASGLNASVEYYWYDAEHSTDPLAIGQIFETPALEKSKTYFVAARNSLGCEGQRIQVEAEVSHIEEAIISFDGGVLSSNYTGNLQWYLDDQPIEGAVNQELVPLQSGTYSVVANVGGCQTSAYYEFSVTGIEDSSDGRVSVYPNPTKERVIVELRNVDPAELVLMNHMGQTVGSAVFSVKDGIQNAEFDLINTPTGVYLLRIRQGVRDIYFKIIKE